MPDRHVLRPAGWHTGLGTRTEHARLNVRNSSLGITYALDINGVTIVTADIRLQNGETIANAVDGTITLSGIIRPTGGAGAAAANAVLLGVGTSADPSTTATADKKFIELRCSTTATSGDNRLAYMEYSLSGTGGGECLRANTRVLANVATAHGAHIGLEFLATAGASECSGLGVAVRGTLMIPNVASWAPTGTYAAGMFEIFSVGSNSDPAGMTELSFLRICNSGDGTGKADVDTDAYFLSLQGFDDSKSGGNVIQVDGDEPTWDNVTTYIKVKLNSEVMYLLAVPTYAVD